MITQKNQIIFISLCFLYQTPVQANPAGDTIDFIILKDTELEHLDGSPWINIENMFRFQQVIKDVRNSILHTKPQYHTFEELVEFHRKHPLPPKLHKKILESIIKKFVHQAAPYMLQIRPIKRLMLRLINQWAKMHNRPDTALLGWGSSNADSPELEEIFLREKLTALDTFDAFLLDVYSLLEDIKHSCPKSYQQHLQCVQLIQAQKHESTPQQP